MSWSPTLSKRVLRAVWAGSWVAVLPPAYLAALEPIRSDQWQQVPVIALLGLLFAVKSIQFLVGNVSYLEETYDEKGFWRWWFHEGAYRSPNAGVLALRTGCDAGLFLLHGFAFAGMAGSIGDPNAFMQWTVVLLLSDCTMLLYNPRTWPASVRLFALSFTAKGRPDRAGRSRWRIQLVADDDYAPRKWLVNNLVSAMLLVGLESLGRAFLQTPEASMVQLVLFTVILLANSFLDFRLTNCGLAVAKPSV